MDYVCRKLGLAPGESVVEAGCGWGALALYMARHYGLTREQLEGLKVDRNSLDYAED